MNIVIPMAGRGSRLRPHTLTVPKPLVPVAGKPIVQRLVEEIHKICQADVEEIAFVIGDFGEAVEQELISIAESMGSKGRIYYQDQPLGTAHAVLCAKESLKGDVVVAFADTLFDAGFQINASEECTIWVKQIDDPTGFGVVKLDDNGYISDFVEKPEVFVSDLAIIGVYSFNDGENLRAELEYLIDNDIKEKGEYQLTNVLDNMKNKGVKFAPQKVAEWLDCGNKNNTVHTNQRILEFNKGLDLVDSSAEIVDSVVIQPSFLGKNVKVKNSIIGPHVSIGENSVIESSVIKNSIVQTNTTISHENMENSMIGNHAVVQGSAKDLSIGDYSQQSNS